MRIKVKAGVTTIELDASERRYLAKAKEVLMALAQHAGGEGAETCLTLARNLAVIESKIVGG